MNYPDNLMYTPDHEWVRMEGNIAVIGITDFAQSELGDIVFVEVETVDEELYAEEVFGSVEAVKTVSDLYMPVAGKVVELNAALEEDPELINKDPYGEGWIIKVEVEEDVDLSNLLDAGAYAESLG